MSIDTASVKSWIEQNIREIRGYDDVAVQFHISRESLRKAFVRREGITVSRFISGVKLKRCQELLRTTDLLCFQIVYELKLGRDDVAARWFKRETGITMAEYRRTQKTLTAPVVGKVA
ncbi:MAG: AraC family transcriptional regulator [Ignavibacteria bacterium]|nr:AraC family transcriptional regulator [Ignavibacteria bacterium]